MSRQLVAARRRCGRTRRGALRHRLGSPPPPPSPDPRDDVRVGPGLVAPGTHVRRLRSHQPGSPRRAPRPGPENGVRFPEERAAPARDVRDGVRGLRPRAASAFLDGAPARSSSSIAAGSLSAWVGRRAGNRERGGSTTIVARAPLGRAPRAAGRRVESEARRGRLPPRPLSSRPAAVGPARPVSRCRRQRAASRTPAGAWSRDRAVQPEKRSAEPARGPEACASRFVSRQSTTVPGSPARATRPARRWSGRPCARTASSGTVAGTRGRPRARDRRSDVIRGSLDPGTISDSPTALPSISARNARRRGRRCRSMTLHRGPPR